MLLWSLATVMLGFAASFIALYARLTRAAMLEVQRQDYVRLPALLQDLAHQPDLAVRVRGPDGHLWFDSSPRLPLELETQQGLGSLQINGTDYRVLVPHNDSPDTPQLNIFAIGFPLTLVLGMVILWIECQRLHHRHGTNH